jgi:hypothetical protein
MSKQIHPKLLRRMLSAENGRRILNHRFNRAIDRGDRTRKAQANMVILSHVGWEKLTGSGLIHKGRKP